MISLALKHFSYCLRFFKNKQFTKTSVVPKVMTADLHSTKVAVSNVTLEVCAVCIERCVNVSVRALQCLMG